MATPKTKTIELYFYRDVVSDKEPTIDAHNRLTAPDDAATTSVCDDGRKLFGLDPDDVPDGKVVRVRLTVEAVEEAGWEVKTVFKPFKPVRAARTRKAE